MGIYVVIQGVEILKEWVVILEDLEDSVEVILMIFRRANIDHRWKWRSIRGIKINKYKNINTKWYEDSCQDNKT